MDVPFKIDLGGQVAVVTGGTGVIGGMYARALAACGAKVAVLGRSKENGWRRGYGGVGECTRPRKPARCT